MDNGQRHPQAQAPPSNWFWYVGGALLVLVVLQFLYTPTSAENLSYSDFKTLLAANKLSELTLSYLLPSTLAVSRSR